jgi:flagella basal body P-ring formation protein FlgA
MYRALSLVSLIVLLAAPVPVLGQVPAAGRAVGVVEAEDITARLRALIPDNTLGPLSTGSALTVELDNAGLRLSVPPGRSATVGVESLAVDPRTGRLSAQIFAPADDPRAERVKITGRVRASIDIPVLNRVVAPGEVITANDVEWATIRSERLNPSTVIALADLIGKSPRRSVRPLEPVRSIDIQTPVVVKRGDIITITVQTDHMFLSAQGRALEDGGSGSTIRVANTKSNRVIDAVVTGPGTAVVGLAQRVAASR